MNPMGRNLSIDMHGDDVMQLHSELRRLGYNLPEEELRQAYFGPGTRQAVLAFQRAHSLPETGIVDARTAAALTEAVAALGARPAPPAPAPSTAPGAPLAPGNIAEPEPAVPTQPLPASVHPTAPSGPSQPAPGSSAPSKSAWWAGLL